MSLEPNNSKNRFLTSSSLPQDSRSHSRLASRQGPLAPNKNSEEPPGQNSNSSSCLDLEALPAIPPLHFFAMTVEVPEGKKGRLLPDTTALLGDILRFAEVVFTWNAKGIHLKIDVRKPFEEVFYPDYKKGDAFEFFFDTRDLKTAGFPTRFCHHFLVLPKDVQGVQCQELTHFRTEDTHPLCNGDEIIVGADFASRSYTLDITFPAHVLHGYDPLNFDRLGFTYRFHRVGGEPQYFSSKGNVEQNPSSWATLKLTR
jgi:hypothetical protein